MRARRMAPILGWVVLILFASASNAAASSTTTVVQRNYAFSPSTLTVTQGSTLDVHNGTPSTSHTFTISGRGIDVVTTGGQTTAIQVNLPPGKYQFICRFHVALGMKGTLRVLSSSAASSSPSPSPSSSPISVAIPSGAPQTGAGGTASKPFPIMPAGLGSILFLGGVLAALRRRDGGPR